MMKMVLTMPNPVVDVYTIVTPQMNDKINTYKNLHVRINMPQLIAKMLQQGLILEPVRCKFNGVHTTIKFPSRHRFTVGEIEICNVNATVKAGLEVSLHFEFTLLRDFYDENSHVIKTVFERPNCITVIFEEFKSAIPSVKSECNKQEVKPNTTDVVNKSEKTEMTKKPVKDIVVPNHIKLNTLCKHRYVHRYNIYDRNNESRILPLNLIGSMYPQSKNLIVDGIEVPSSIRKYMVINIEELGLLPNSDNIRIYFTDSHLITIELINNDNSVISFKVELAVIGQMLSLNRNLEHIFNDFVDTKLQSEYDKVRKDFYESIMRPF